MVIDLTNQNVVNWRGDDSFLKYFDVGYWYQTSL